MIIRGILDRSLSNQICIRGFARIKELARISKANAAYQRELVDKQEKIVSNFLTEENELLFFPEVILSLKLKYDNTARNADFSLTPVQTLVQKNMFSSNVDSLKIRASKKNYKSSFDINEKNEIVNAEIEFDDVEIHRLVSENKHPLHRIDGNHRLSAAEQVGGDRIERMNIPYCIVLFEETTSLEFNPISQLQEKVTSKQYEKFEKVVFNNINFKSLPLTQEQNLRVILDDEVNFPDDEVEKIFGKSWLYTRKLYNKIKIEHLHGIKHLLEENLRTYSRNIFEILLSKDYKEITIIDDVFESFKTVEQLYSKEKKLHKNISEGLLVAFLFYRVMDEIKFDFFKKWVLKHNVFNVEEAKAETIIQMFDKDVEQEIKVFVAMPYFEKNPTIVADYDKIYKDVINNIRAKFKIKISLYPIMESKGETQDQIQDIINKIKECNIFIADISDNNANVMYETGWARALGKHVLLFREKESEKPKSDYANDTYHVYDDKARATTLTEVAEKNIKEILNKNFGLINE